MGLNQHKHIGQGMLSEYSSDYVSHISATKGTYTRDGKNGFTFVNDNGKKLTVITPLDYSEETLPDGKGGTITKKTYTGVGVILENFSSPLVLDLNNNGIYNGLNI